MIAKWSEIFELSKMRLFGRTHFCFRISRAKPPKALVSPSSSSVAFTVPM